MARYTIDNQPAAIAFDAAGDVARTVQNAKNLLMTRMGEVPYDRLRGFDPALYDLPMPLLRAELAREIDRVLLWEPDAELVEANADLLADGSVRITAIIEVGE